MFILAVEQVGDRFGVVIVKGNEPWLFEKGGASRDSDRFCNRGGPEDGGY